MWKPLALVLVACVAVVTVPVALAQTQGNPTPTQPTPSQPAVPACDPTAVDQALALSRWQIRRPLAGINTSCVSRAHLTKMHERWRRWSAYRHLATYRSGCTAGGKWLTWTTVPGYVVVHESGCSWTAANPSGACGPYQLLGWTSCDTSTWQDKMRHHRMAAYVLREQGLGPAWTSNW